MEKPGKLIRQTYGKVFNRILQRGAKRSATYKEIRQKADIQKINNFLAEIQVTPRSGTGQPKQLKYLDGEVWSRKINKKDRLIYRIYENKLIIIIISSYGHYGDK